ncbi:MAG: sulfotransferase family 2 domain-containing protein [Pseudomonadota bacterium]
MSLHLSKERISVVTIPKCLSTSLCHFFFALENGVEADELVVKGKPAKINVHKHYFTHGFEKCKELSGRGFWRATFVRDPMSRIISTYRNRILHAEILKKQGVTDKKLLNSLPSRPDLETFVMNLESYQKAHKKVLHHTHPLSYFLGKKPSYFNRIYTMKQVAEFRDEMKNRMKRPVPEVRRLYTEGPEFSVSDLNQKCRNHIETMFEEDYRIFGKYFEQQRA